MLLVVTIESYEKIGDRLIVRLKKNLIEKLMFVKQDFGESNSNCNAVVCC